jgi:glycerol-3-phosphate O-acyltransferase/dihydroxyacetone phosphate acyltransferase
VPKHLLTKPGRIPKRGPVLFVASPHHNQFVDPLILLRVIRHDSKRRVSFLIAEKSMKRRFIGFGARLVGAVPVARAMDYVKPAPGTIYMPDPDNDPTLIRGYGTNFETLELGGRIVLPKVRGEKPNADILEINGPEELRLKREFRHPAAVDLLTGRGKTVPDGVKEKPKEFHGCTFSTTPKVDTSGVFDAVFSELLGGGCVGIFPEGGSHDRPNLLPLQGE